MRFDNGTLVNIEKAGQVNVHSEKKTIIEVLKSELKLTLAKTKKLTKPDK